MISHHNADNVLCAVTANDGGQKTQLSKFFFLFFFFFFGDCNFRSVTFVTLYKSMKGEREEKKSKYIITGV